MLGRSCAAIGVLLAGLACRPDATPAIATPDAKPEPVVAAATTAAVGIVPTTPPPAAVDRLLANVSSDRLRKTVDRLAAFGTRHTLSPAAPDRGIVAARTWLAEEMRAAGGRLEVSFDAHEAAPDGRRIDAKTEVVNVVAVLPGAMPEAATRRYYVIGHYDSRNSDPMDRKGDAPGANDDGSGTALVVELSRVLAAERLDATVVFMATAGEEQGLVGARKHAAAAKKAGLDVRGVLSNDIVGDPSTPDGGRLDKEIRVFSEGLPAAIDQAELARLRGVGAENDSASRQLARFVAQVGAWQRLPVQAALRYRPDRYLRGGDHTGFNEQGFAAVRFTEMAEKYDRQHQDVRTEGDRSFGDLPEHVDAEYLAGVARLNAAALVHLANAPSQPARARVVAADLATTTVLRWDASPEPDLAGYEVVWRTTSAPDWENSQDVAKNTELELPKSKDDLHFGVRAYDDDGYRSPVSFCLPATQ